MKAELDAALCEKYPKLLRDRYASEMETCMCWGFSCGDGWYTLLDALMGNIQSHIDWRMQKHEYAIKLNEIQAQVANGGMTLFNAEYARLTEVAREEKLEEFLADARAGKIREVPPKPEQVVLSQVKEKFGTLRFYYNGGHSDDYINGLVSMAESMSGRMCEDCGNVGKRNGGGWIRTLCDSCEIAYQKRKESYKDNSDD